MFAAARAKAAEIAEMSKASVAAVSQATSKMLADEVCTKCQKVVTATSNILGSSIRPCCCCEKKFCADCRVKTKLPIPEECYGPTAKRPEEGLGYVCFDCHSVCVVIWMDSLTKEHKDSFKKSLEEYLRAGHIAADERPGPTQDTRYRKAMRLVRVGELVADSMGYSKYFMAIKYAAMGGSLLNVLLENNALLALAPVVDALTEFGIKGNESPIPYNVIFVGPSDMLSIYYLGCSYELDRKLNPNAELDGHNEGDPGVLVANCSEQMLDQVGQYAGPAQWLYSAQLLPPHQGEEWSRWYLSRLVTIQGWSLLACVCKASTLPNGVNCPAFALVAKDGSEGKQAMLVIRGTQTHVDWQINLKEESLPYEYPSNAGVVCGYVHSGMMLGATGILDSYAVRESINRLLEAGYDFKTVGHSLGASTSCLIAMDVRRGCDPSHWSRIKSVGFGTPPCVSAEIADALIADDLVRTTIHRDDVVPRMSRINLQKLATEVKAFKPKAEIWQKDDEACLKHYAKTYGLAGDMKVEQKVIEKEDLEKPTEKAEPKPLPAKLIVNDPTIPDALQVAEIIEPSAPAIKLVVPGTIIHLTMSHGVYHATLCDYKLTSLCSMIPLRNGVANHKMQAHMEALRCIKLRSTIHTVRSSPPWEAVYKQDTKQWAVCCVCNCDVTWAYITHSDASRALVTHNCRACGKIVCSVCSPAGDTIPGEGIYKNEELDDHRISLPSLGLIERQRVCVPCYLNSYGI